MISANMTIGSHTKAMSPINRSTSTTSNGMVRLSADPAAP
jgi:hypothetical protein